MSERNQETRQLINRIVDSYLNPEAGINAKGNPPRAKLKALSERFDMSPARIRKILVGEGVFENKSSAVVEELRAQGKSIDEIIQMTGLSRSSVNNYLSYEKGLYKNRLADETECNKRVIKHRENKTMEDCVGSVLLPSRKKRVLFFSKADLSIGFYIDTVKEYLICDHDISSLDEAIHAFNCYLFISNGIIGKEWTQDETTIILKNSKAIKDKVCRFLFSNPSIVLDRISDLEWDYKRSVLRISASLNLYKEWNREQFQKVLDDSLIWEVMEIEKLVKFFDKEITFFLLNHIEIASKLLFDNNTIQIGDSSENRYHFPPSFGINEKVKVLKAYCQSDHASLDGLICILNMKDIINRIGIDTKELIQRTIDQQTIERMNSFPQKETTFLELGVRFVPSIPSTEKTNPEDNKRLYMDYPLEELDNRLDFEGIQFCLRKMFGILDPQNGLVALSRKKREFSLIDDLLGSKFKNGYNLSSHQQTVLTLTYGTLVLYNNYLNSHGIYLEKHLGSDFTSYLNDKYGMDLYGFDLPVFEESFLTRCSAIAPRIESLLNRLFLLEQGKTIDKFSLSSVSGVRFSSIESVLPDKYLYVTRNKKKAVLVNNLSYLLFSVQHLFLINKEIVDEQKLKCNFDLLLMRNINRSEIMDCEQHKVAFLMDHKCIVEHNGCLKPTNRALALKELWDNGCIATYHSPCGFKVLATMKNDGWLIGERSLLARPEQELLSFIYDNKLFSDAWGLRNCYAHGSSMHLEEEQHKQNYMWFIYIIIVLESKLFEEIEILQKMNDESRS